MLATFDGSGDDSGRFRSDYIVSTLAADPWIEVIILSIANGNFDSTKNADALLGLGLGIQLIREV